MLRASGPKLLLLPIIGILLCASAGARGNDGNLIANSGSESEKEFQWYGASATVERTRTQPHSGDWCLHITDSSKSARGHADSGFTPVALRGGGRYYAEAWSRVDTDFASRTGYGITVVNVQFFDAEKNWLCTQQVGKTSSTHRMFLNRPKRHRIDSETRPLATEENAQCPGSS